MEHIQDTEQFMEKYRLLLARGEELTLPVLGSSMAPFLVHRRDMVWLAARPGPYKVGDIVLYRRESGAYILHRICRAADGQYTMVGDAHTILEQGIPEDRIIAVVTRVKRKGKIYEPGSLLWDFFAGVWSRMIPFRSVVLRGISVWRKVSGGKDEG